MCRRGVQSPGKAVGTSAAFLVCWTCGIFAGPWTTLDSLTCYKALRLSPLSVALARGPHPHQLSVTEVGSTSPLSRRHEHCFMSRTPFFGLL